MKKLMLLLVVLTLTGFKGGPTKNLVTETSRAIRTVSFETIHNLNVPMERADGRLVFPLTYTNTMTMDRLRVTTGTTWPVELKTIQ